MSNAVTFNTSSNNYNKNQKMAWSRKRRSYLQLKLAERQTQKSFYCIREEEWYFLRAFFRHENQIKFYNSVALKTNIEVLTSHFEKCDRMSQGLCWVDIM